MSWVRVLSFLEPGPDFDVIGIRAEKGRGKVSVFNLFSTYARNAVVAVCVLTVTGCVAVNRNHGYVPPEDVLAEIIVGVDTKDTVDEVVGSPSASGVQRDSGYYYVASKIRHFGALAPKVVERELVAISFDGAGTVQAIERFGLQDGRAVALERRITDNGTTDRTFLRQLLGNIGNFNPGQFLDQ